MKQRETEPNGAPPGLLIRNAAEADLPRLLEIYNYEVENGIATFDIRPQTLEERRAWFEEHRGRWCLLSAVAAGAVAGYASLSRFSAKEAYFPTAELSVYVAREHRGRGIGTGLIEAVIARARADGNFKNLVAVITSANTGSVRLHQRLGFRLAGHIEDAGRKAGRPLSIDYYVLRLGAADP